MNTFYKAVSPTGTDFHTGRVDYDAAFASESGTIAHSRARVGSENAAEYFSVSTIPTDCTGFRWPCKLYEVEAVGEVWTPHPDSLPNKRAAAALKLVRELPAWQVFGPEGELIVAIIDRFDALTDDERRALRVEYRASYDKFWSAVDAVAFDGRAARAGLSAARVALRGRRIGWYVGGDAAYGAALAVLIRSRIGTGKDDFKQSEYDTLSRAWRKVIGPIHPADKAVK